MHVQNDSIRYVAGLEALDLAALLALIKQAFWIDPGEHRLLEKEFRNSALVVGAYDGATLVGLARCVSDKGRFAYLSDVYVLENYRGRGIGTHLIHTIMRHPDLQDVTQWLLLTRDAHGFYQKLGWENLRPNDWLSRRMTRAEKDAGKGFEWPQSVLPKEE